MNRFAWIAFFSTGLIVSIAMCAAYQARIGTDAEKASDPIVLAVWAVFSVLHAIFLAIHLVRLVRAGPNTEQRR